MLKKLIKYDLIWINKIMVIYFVIALICSGLTRVMSFFDTSFIGNILYQIIKGVTISAFASCIINSIIRIWVRLRNTTYKDEGYLVNTLPVSKKLLYNSKMISSILSILVCILVIILCFIIAFLNSDIIDFIKNMFSNSSFIIVGIIITIILEINYMMYCGITGILLGHKKNSKRTLRSVIIGIGAYFFLQLIILGITYFIGLFNSDISALFNSNLVIDSNINAIKALIIVVDILYLIIAMGMYLVGKKVFIKGFDVE